MDSKTVGAPICEKIPFAYFHLSYPFMGPKVAYYVKIKGTLVDKAAFIKYIFAVSLLT